MNQETGLGIAGKDKTLGTQFGLDLVDSECALLMWRGDPIAARLVEVPPNEALRQGFELLIGDDDQPEPFTPPKPEPVTQAAPGKVAPPKATKTDADRAFAKRHPSAYARITRKAITRQRMDAGDAKPLQESITKQINDLQLAAAIKEAMCYERAGGGGAIFIGANDFTTDLRVPLDLKKVRSLDYLTPLEGREIIPLYYYNDPMKPKFGLAAIYQLVPFVVGSPVDPSYSPRVTQIHESRLLTFPGIRCTRRLLQTSTTGWGDNIFTRVNRALRGFNTGNQSAEILLSDFAQAVYKIKGLAALIARDPQNALIESMMNIELGRSIARAVVIDEDESFERQSTTMAGYPETLDRLALNLAAAADMPMTLLMGQSPAGLNATGASDIRFFYDRTASVQTLRIAPLILRIVEILLACAGEDPDKVNHSVKFNPLWQPTEKEIADAHFAQAQTDAIYITNSVVSPEEIALSRFGGDTYSYETRVDFESRDAQNAVVAPPVDANPAPTFTPGQVPAPNAFNYSPDPTQTGPTPKAALQPTNDPTGRAPNRGADE